MLCIENTNKTCQNGEKRSIGGGAIVDAQLGSVDDQVEHGKAQGDRGEGSGGAGLDQPEGKE